MVKRIFDIVIATIIILIFTPVYFVVTIMVLIGMGRPVFFIQDRPGLYGRVFRLYKFRTMREEIDNTNQNLADAVRLYPVGRLLRRLSLDELPQLFNVLRGDMSIVGPRPLLVEYLPLYTSEQARRHNVKPGITGWAQINGRNLISWEDRFKLDVWYVENQSFLLDLKILLLTIYKILRGDGVSQVGHVSMEKFRGSIK